MNLTNEEQRMLDGEFGEATRKSMEILTALGSIYGAERLVPVASVQVSGVSYANLGDAGLDYLDSLAKDGRVRVFTTLNPAGMDLIDWKNLGIPEDFAIKQLKVIDAFKKMEITPICTCTPYLAGNLPRFGDHLAWGESSAVCFANSVIGARTNREGGPSALAAALTGRTAEFGYHLEENRRAKITIKVEAKLRETPDFGALGKISGDLVGNKPVLFKGIDAATLEQLKSFGASIATYGGTAIYHMEGITPNEAGAPSEEITITQKELDEAKAFLDDDEEPDFVSIGCPHASVNEVKKVAGLLDGRKVTKELWICTSRATKAASDQSGYTKTIEDAGAKFACDTCMVVAPVKGRFKCIATDSAKSCYYMRGKNNAKTCFRTLEECVELAVK